MRQIGQTDLLTREQELKLAQKIRQGDALARHLMITANLRLVVKIAQDFAQLGLSLKDVISEGNIGLVKAVDRYDPHKGGKFSSYAAWWIKQSMRRAVAMQGKTIGYPVHLGETIGRIKSTVLELAAELEREPSDQEVADHMGLPCQKIAHLKSISIRPASLDAPIGISRISFGEIVGDEGALNPFESLYNKSLAEEVAQSMGQLEEREEKIIRLRFGLDDGPPMTLEKLGEHFGISRERVRQLQNQSLKRMRGILADKERLLSRSDLQEEKRQRRRMRILKEFFDAKRKDK